MIWLVLIIATWQPLGLLMYTATVCRTTQNNNFMVPYIYNGNYLYIEKAIAEEDWLVNGYHCPVLLRSVVGSSSFLSPLNPIVEREALFIRLICF